MNSINRTDKSLHLKCSWKLPQVDVSIPGFCPGVAEPRPGVFGRREGVPGNAAAGSTLRVLWINGTQTCREIPAQGKQLQHMQSHKPHVSNITDWAVHKSEFLGISNELEMSH